jgi:LCP family protein required for cell wall assembly
VKRKDPLWARLFVILGALVMMTSGGIMVGGTVLIGKFTSTVNNEQMLGDAGTDQKGGKSIKGPLNILMVGIDQRPGSKESVRSDTIIILHVPASHDQAYLVSIPRDLLATIPDFPKNKVRQQTAKINTAFALGSDGKGGRAGGFELLALTISRRTGLKFNAGAIVDFGGFEKVVNQFGGIDMCIDTEVESIHVGTDRNGKFLAPSKGGKPHVYKVGCRRLAPWEALDYVRQRKSDAMVNGDYDRQRHQQQFLKALLKEAKKQGITSNPVKAYQVMNAAGSALTVATQGVSLEDWAYTLRNITDHEITMLKTNGGKVNSVEVAGLGSCEQLTEESEEMFRAMRGGTVMQFVLAHPHFVASLDSAK